MSGENDKMKSALDVALERARRLGSLSAEERQSLKEKDLATAGEALARRYLAGFPLRDVEIELKRHREGERQTVTGYILSGLVEAISFGDLAGAEKILAAIRHISRDSGAGEAIEALFREYQRAMEEAWQENRSRLEAARGSELALKGISGSAVELGIETCAEWLETRHRLDSHYRERLEAGRREMSR
jgi:hypothetical protein